MDTHASIRGGLRMKKSEYDLKELCLEITNVCPLNCIHCSGKCNLKSSLALSIDKIKQIINDFAFLGGKTLEISGGEPLLHPALPQIINYASKRRLETILYTSGNVLSSHRKPMPVCSNLALKLRRAGLSKVIFSLQGATASTHEAVTQVKGSFDNVLHSIGVIKKYGFWIGVHFVPMKVNFKEFAAVCALSNRLQVNEIGVLRFVPQGRGRDNIQDLSLTKTEFAEFSSLLKKLVDTWGPKRIRIGRPVDFRFIMDPYKTKTECDAGKSRCLISPDGKVKPCPAFKNCEDKYVAGNIKDESLVNIWNETSKWVDLRQFDYKLVGEPCSSCDSLQKCKGGCLAQKLLKYDDLYAGPDPCCFKAIIPVTAIHPSGARIQKQVRG
ncbi:MAG: radical SAM protein [Candidatus Jordarchaeaceae archaeon]